MQTRVAAGVLALAVAAGGQVVLRGRAQAPTSAGAIQPQPLPGRTQARSMVISKLGIVAASQTLAAQAGAQILAEGGSAADAAIAANITLGVVEPMMNGMGGDLFAIEWDAKSGHLSGLNSSGWAPEHETPDYLRAKGYKEMPGAGIDSVTVPGAVRGWEALHAKFGKLPWAALFQPAIYYATHGYPVTEWISAEWQSAQQKLERDPAAKAEFMPEGHTPRVGEVFRNPSYARALELVAAKGPAAFYDGDIARAILATEKRLGGVMSAEDLADFRPEWVQPISTAYHGWSVYELPPNTQGFGALEMLNIFAHFPLAQWGFADPRTFFVKTEAQKLAYADLRAYDGDPRMAKIPVTGLISKAYGEARAAQIDMNRANCSTPPGDAARFNSDTVYLTAVDADGNIVSLIQSLFSEFGSGVVVPEYGITLQNRGSLFVLTPGHPDVLAPHKRPFHTLIPGFMQKGDLHMGFGIMGGLNQAQAHAQFVSDIADDGMDIQAAMEAPRFTNLSFGGCTFQVENRIPRAVRDALQAKGDTLRLVNAYSDHMGGGQAVMHDSATGVNYGASDPRKDGEAVPQPPALGPKGGGK
ncbi:MAG: gamma-glutamyltransferase [Acidobacteriota bacterium]|nr:gamma-glutamyltransferase [Acidobacteriota bacterium]